MCKNTTRAVRRHHYARLKNTRCHDWGYGKHGWRDGTEMPKDAAGMVTRTPTPCSCWMCGNPRHNGWEIKLTMQERKALEAYEYQIEELDS